MPGLPPVPATRQGLLEIKHKGTGVGFLMCANIHPQDPLKYEKVIRQTELMIRPSSQAF